ncbi:hypothetical protein VP01_2848g1 [Puccinia sorghi]|uniref:Uncharacterized protein n=1 Tax=Puccinia sorghi TaxID=27349 RepID=A0A0L6V215_9BASI|nr:hypothetical protein VP01_2848g1 [Puccinia sorghi]
MGTYALIACIQALCSSEENLGQGIINSSVHTHLTHDLLGLPSSAAVFDHIMMKFRMVNRAAQLKAWLAFININPTKHDTTAGLHSTFNDDSSSKPIFEATSVKPLTRKLTFLWQQIINKRHPQRMFFDFWTPLGLSSNSIHNTSSNSCIAGPQDHQEIELNAVGKRPICYICKKT